MKILTLLITLSLFSAGCATKEQPGSTEEQPGSTEEQCVVTIKIEESYVGESESKLSLVTVVEGINGLELKEPGYGITYWIYSSRDDSTSELTYSLSGGWQMFGSLNCVTNRSSLAWDEMINTNDYKYLTVLYKIDKDGTGEVLMQNWKRYKIDWRINPNHPSEVVRQL